MTASRASALVDATRIFIVPVIFLVRAMSPPRFFRLVYVFKWVDEIEDG
jgi:hypothetical protein